MRFGVKWLLSVVVGLSFTWALPAMAEDQPAETGSLECEGIRELRALHSTQQAILAQNGDYTVNITELIAAGFMPAACPDGSRAPLWRPNMVGGCHFTYNMQSVTVGPGDSVGFTAVAYGVAGTPSEGLYLFIGRDQSEGKVSSVFWLFRDEVRRDVGLNECTQAE